MITSKPGILTRSAGCSRGEVLTLECYPTSHPFNASRPSRCISRLLLGIVITSISHLARTRARATIIAHNHHPVLIFPLDNHAVLCRQHEAIGPCPQKVVSSERGGEGRRTAVVVAISVAWAGHVV